MIAMGVRHAKLFVWSAVAPVRKGDVCATARVGTAVAESAARARATRARRASFWHII
jgi:hypothetical protein